MPMEIHVLQGLEQLINCTTPYTQGTVHAVFCRSQLRELALGIGYLKVSVPEPMLVGTRFFSKRGTMVPILNLNRGTARTAQAYITFCSTCTCNSTWKHVLILKQELCM